MPNDENVCINMSEYNPVDEFICSECKIILQDYIMKKEATDLDDYEYEFNYCPNCGRRVLKE